MSFHELISGYPWLTKRAARLVNVDATMPPRNVFSYILAAFIPYAGRLGGGFAMLMAVYIIALLAAVAIPAYQDYTIKAKVSVAMVNTQPARDSIGHYYLSNHKVPESLESAGVPQELADGTKLYLDPQQMVLTVSTKQGDLVFTPSMSHGQLMWGCKNGEGLKPSQIPSTCH